MNDLTVIYYTSNREDPEFEGRIQKTLLEEMGDLPLISVSQKPIDFGKNICIGDVGATARNMLLQVRAGALEAKTKFIVFAEADVLYHKSYFEFRPERYDTFYYPDEVYLIWIHRKSFWRKRRKEITSIVSREHFIRTVNKILSEYTPGCHIVDMVGEFTSRQRFSVDMPVVSIKTRNGMHWKSSFSRSGSKTSLPYWGDGKALMEKYCP